MILGEIVGWHFLGENSRTNFLEKKFKEEIFCEKIWGKILKKKLSGGKFWKRIYLGGNFGKEIIWGEILKKKLSGGNFEKEIFWGKITGGDCFGKFWGRNFLRGILRKKFSGGKLKKKLSGGKIEKEIYREKFLENKFSQEEIALENFDEEIFWGEF